jgi:predicted TIM-barrel fold metal-dependent hydrolase
VTGAVDLSHAEIVDDHVHPFRLGDVLARDADGFEARLGLMGTCFASARTADPGLWHRVHEQSAASVFAMAARRWLAERFGCAPDPDSVAAARFDALRTEGVGYVHRLLAEQRIVGLVTDEGYPQPTVPAEEFEPVAGAAVHRVVRIEPLIDRLRTSSSSLSELHDALEAELAASADDPRTVAFKSTIAYRTGLDVEDVSEADARSAFDRWKDDGFAETRHHAKPVRDFLLYRTLDVAAARGLAMHIHTGDGDPDVVFGHAKPSDLYPLLVARMGQPIVLIHGGHPWSHETAYIASVLPNAYADLSVLLPWAASGADGPLALLVGMVPTSKLLYASDEASEPEVLWLSARIGRAAVERVLGDAVDRGFLTVDEATRAGEGILGGNTRRLHGLN